MQETVLRFLCLLGACAATLAQAAEPANSQKQAPRTTDELSRAIAAVLEETDTPGAGLALVSREELLFSTGIGLANRASKAPVTADTMFRAGSISKSFTALALLQLQEAGRLKLEDRVRDLAPEAQFANPWEDSEPVRLVHLLEHTAGFDEISLREFAASRPDSRLADDINFDPRPRTSRWRPGQFFSYSNADYSVAGYVLEIVSGQSFDDYLGVEILRPLDMAGASFLYTEEVRRKLATGYGPDGTTPRAYEHIIGRPSGALNCTPTELSHLVQMSLQRGVYREKRILSAASIDRMETPATSTAARRGLRDGYGLGNYSTAHQGYRIFGHAGGVDGFLARYAYSPEHGVGFVLMLNGSSPEALDRCEKIILDYLARDWPPPTIEPVTLPEEPLAAFCGFYEPHTPRLEKSRFLFRLLGLQRIAVQDGALRLQGLFAGPNTYLPAEMVGAFRRDEEPAPTILFFEDAGEVFLASASLRLGNLRRRPAWQFWLQSMGLLYCGAVMLTGALFPVIWLPRKLLGYLRGVEHLSVRLLPSLAALSFFGFFGVMLSTLSDPIGALGRPTVWSVGICALTWLFAAFTVAGLVQVVRARTWNIQRWVWRHALLVSIANALALGYLAYYGVIGLRTWI